MIRELSPHFHCITAIILEGRFIDVHLGMKFQGRRNPYYQLSANTIRKLNFLVLASLLFSSEIYTSPQDQHKTNTRPTQV